MEPTAATAAAREKQKETEIGRRMGGGGEGRLRKGHAGVKEERRERRAGGQAALTVFQ